MAEMRLDNTRDPEQRRIMEEQLRLGICHFCREGFETRHKAPIVHEKEFWFITANNFPYVKDEGTHHYLIVPKRHVAKITELNIGELIGLQSALQWLEKKLQVSGYSFFMRNGDMAYTGATLSHLHGQFLVGVPKPDDKPESRVLVTLGYTKINPVG